MAEEPNYLWFAEPMRSENSWRIRSHFDGRVVANRIPQLEAERACEQHNAEVAVLLAKAPRE